MSLRDASIGAVTDKSDRDVLFARLLVVVATVAVFLVLSVPWYVTEGETPTPASGWSLFAELAGDSVGVYASPGYFGWAVVLAALVAGVGVLRLARRWVCGALSTALVLLAGGLLLVDLRFENDMEGVQLAGAWAVLPGTAVRRGGVGQPCRPLRELSYQST
jgi:hypothetical protein